MLVNNLFSLHCIYLCVHNIFLSLSVVYQVCDFIMNCFIFAGWCQSPKVQNAHLIMLLVHLPSLYTLTKRVPNVFLVLHIQLKVRNTPKCFLKSQKTLEDHEDFEGCIENQRWSLEKLNPHLTELLNKKYFLITYLTNGRWIRYPSSDFQNDDFYQY